MKSLTGSERAQTINYLKASGRERALLLNFGTPLLEIERFVNFDFETKPSRRPQNEGVVREKRTEGE